MPRESIVSPGARNELSVRMYASNSRVECNHEFGETEIGN